jgi:predicted alpha/beta hydrolase family esterase
MSGTVLTLPGWTGAGPYHWMSVWERLDPTIVRVEQFDWDDPEPEEWSDALEEQVARAVAPVVLVGHSLGASTVARWASHDEARIAGALLVAPPDSERDGIADEVARFGAVRRSPLPFPTILVASRNDPACGFSRASEFARWWGAELVDAGDAGHINTASGYGPWPEGRALLERLRRPSA